MGIAFAAFVIGALLTGALWYIYSRTGRLEMILFLYISGIGSSSFCGDETITFSRWIRKGLIVAN